MHSAEALSAMKQSTAQVSVESSATCCPKLLGQWSAFEELYRTQQTRAIAVSNFGAAELACLSGHTVLLASAN